ncbi:MAG TPA: ribosome biogenesis GTPase Der [Candidatus Acidoferrales bacterium]|nr:ribosome biogenesis GTPase Der [Candidatus Acidoferrales bacterium]
MSAARALPLVAILGRPNAGKSTLFNRLTGARKAIVHDEPGVTRDLNYGEAEWRGQSFVVVDTGGFEPDPETPLKKQIQEQTRLAIEEADVVVFLFDGKAGLAPLDQEAIGLLRRARKPTLFAVNKIDTSAKEVQRYEFFRLGVEEVFPISAEHGLGLAALLDRIVASLPQTQAGAEEPDQAGALPLRIAVVGRPNVGKSSLVNRLVGYERALVDAAPGTTRDATDTPFSWEGDDYVLVDTAGIRRKARIADRLERYSVLRALRSVDRAQLLIHVIDALEGASAQDAQILSYALRRGKAVVLAVNKWDLVRPQERDAEGYRQRVFARLAFADFAPLVFISARTGLGIGELMALVRRASSSYQKTVPTAQLNRVLQEAVRAHAPASYQGRQVKLYYATQTGTAPPTFTLFVNFPAAIKPDYERFLVHQLRASLALDHTPVRLHFRARRDERPGRRR